MGAWLAVALGGALGASIRFGVNQLVTHWFQAPLFWATLAVNVVGCFAMGLAYQHIQAQVAVNETFRLFVTVGFLGALTTWSTFSMETVVMMQNGQVLKAAVYTLATTLFCFAAFWLGVKS
ncbi:fluoride efflux transporter CrcB [Marinicella meishanensis]|uniref:fluoride efflux transporter CrcB n=1 Tax=Marinicella meishanensis TaxID=2873263 RepID=UPI001CBDB0FB|nr:fluoride efflux transporter CrcB [Marinicella sp. NBU2979]